MKLSEMDEKKGVSEPPTSTKMNDAYFSKIGNGKNESHHDAHGHSTPPKCIRMGATNRSIRDRASKMENNDRHAAENAFVVGNHRA